MSKFQKFMKENKIVKENTTYPVTKSLLDENGEPLLWTIQPLSTKKVEEIREACTFDVPVRGKNGVFRPKVNTSKFSTSLICASVIEPNLNDEELQNSYGVMSAEDLLKEMVSSSGEYNKFMQFISKFNELGEDDFEDKVKHAKK